jgi:hypothetical protein
MIILSQERRSIFKSDFHDRISKQEAANGNGFSTQTPKMWHKCGIN